MISPCLKLPESNFRSFAFATASASESISQADQQTLIECPGFTDHNLSKMSRDGSPGGGGDL